MSGMEEQAICGFNDAEEDQTDFISNALSTRNFAAQFYLFYVAPEIAAVNGDWWEYEFPSENAFQDVQLQWNPQELHPQDFEFFLVIDLEATCDSPRQLRPQEVIEFSCVVVNGSTGAIQGYFQKYVKPQYHPTLTDFCKQLTGIQQNQVDDGVSLSEALVEHDAWLQINGIKQNNFVVVTWTDWDCATMLQSECTLKGIDKPNYYDRWIDLKRVFCQVFNFGRGNLKMAVEFAGLQWIGKAHSGIDDAVNTANLLVHLLKLYRLGITGNLQSQQLKANTLTQLGNQSTSNQHGGRRCFCGVPCNRSMVRKPGPTQGRFFFGCGNWSAAEGSVCGYFRWA